MSLSAARTFLLGAYHDLPNVLFIGSLLFGSMTGNLPLVWVSTGLLFTGAVTGIFRALHMAVVDRQNTAVWRQFSDTCEVFTRMDLLRNRNSSASRLVLIAPSLWIASTVFFATFSVYNAIRLLTRDPVNGAREEMVDTRKAFSMTVIATGVFFACLVFARMFTGCESWYGATLGIAIGIGCAISYWHILDACGTGAMPDIHQVIGSLAPPGNEKEIPVVCVPPSPEPSI
jgi:hypothetical protein